jgi:hypothetical protein
MLASHLYTVLHSHGWLWGFVVEACSRAATFMENGNVLFGCKTRMTHPHPRLVNRTPSTHRFQPICPPPRAVVLQLLDLYQEMRNDRLFAMTRETLNA